MRGSPQLLALALGVLLLISLSSRQARAADPKAEAIANDLHDFAAFGDTIGEFEELGEALPFTELTPGSADGLRLSDLFGDTFAPLPDSFVDLAALETALEGLDGDYGGVDVVIGDVTIAEDTPTTGQIQIVLPLSATRTVSVPVAFEHDIVSLDGGSISIDLAIATTITFRLDTFVLTDPSDPSLAFAIVGEPTIGVDMDATGAIVPLTASIGTDTPVAETDVDAAACDPGNNDDESDGDGAVNDGCPQMGDEAESGRVR
jgi:hypothetical protein